MHFPCRGMEANLTGQKRVWLFASKLHPIFAYSANTFMLFLTPPPLSLVRSSSVIQATWCRRLGGHGKKQGHLYFREWSH